MLVFVWPPRESKGTTGVQLKISLFTVPSLGPPVGLEVPHGTWSIIVTEKNGDRKREKLLFHFSTQWVSPLGLLAQEKVSIMNMLSKYSDSFPDKKKKKRAGCETLLQSCFSRKFIPFSFSAYSCLMLVKVRHCGPQRNLTKTLKLSLLFIPFSPIATIPSVNLTTRQSRDNSNLYLRRNVCTDTLS